MGKIADNPYPGSRAFQQADHALFWGRGPDTAAVVDKWMTNRLTMLSGPVASGKTSLLLAGVYPKMPAKQSRILPIGSLYHGMTFPVAALPDYNPFTFALLRSWSPGDIPTTLAGLTVSNFVRRFTQGSDEPVYAAIDHVDDVILHPHPGARAMWRQRFFAELAQAIDDHPRLHLLLVARTEAIGLLASTVGGGARYAIAALTPKSAVEAVIKPALAAGRTVTDDAVAGLVEDLRARGSYDGHVEPSLLQVVCRRLWDDLPSSVYEISAAAIRGFGDSDIALANYCMQAIGHVAAEYAQVIREQGVESERVPRWLCGWLADNFVTDNGGRAGAFDGEPTTAGLANAVPRSLVDRHVLTREAGDSDWHYRLLTDRLIEPLRMAAVLRAPELTATDYLAASERNLAWAELEFAWQNAQHALDVAPSRHQQAQAESLLGNVEYKRGTAAEAARHYKAAAKHYKEAAALLQATGDTTAAAHQLAALGRVLLAEGHAAEAVPQLRAAVERAPDDLALQTQLALALWQHGEGRTAVAILDWVLTIDGGYLEARRARGEILADLGEAASAIADLDRAVPGQPSTRAARGLALAELGDHTAATEEVNDAVASAQRNGPVLLYAARALDLTGDKISARQRAEAAIDATDPPLSPPHLELALKLAGRE